MTSLPWCSEARPRRDGYVTNEELTIFVGLNEKSHIFVNLIVELSIFVASNEESGRTSLPTNNDAPLQSNVSSPPRDTEDSAQCTFQSPSKVASLCLDGEAMRPFG